MTNQVVVHFLDGRLLKGTSFDVNPEKPECHVHTPDRGTATVFLADVKAIFFVKDLAGHPGQTDLQALDPTDPRTRGALQLDVRFQDGERLVGIVPSYHRNRPFFFVLPVDPKSNNVRILVNRAGTTSVTPV